MVWRQNSSKTFLRAYTDESYLIFQMKLFYNNKYFFMLMYFDVS